jgi:tRNA(Arg) A34 adenosine deaminase TadA
MRRAIELAREGMESGKGGPFGAVIAHGGVIIGEGCNQVLSTSDPTAHAEVTAIRDGARRRRDPWFPQGSVLYTSCEPCPMCLASALWARIERVYFAATRTDAAAIGFDDAHFYEELALAPQGKILTIGQLMRDEAWAIMQLWLAKTDRRQY